MPIVYGISDTTASAPVRMPAEVLAALCRPEGRRRARADRRGTPEFATAYHTTPKELLQPHEDSELDLFYHLLGTERRRPEG